MSSVRVKYHTYEFGDTDVHVKTLRDKQQFQDDDGEAESLGISSAHWPLFGVVWESSELLARLMHSYDIAGLRILEVGCGIGLASIVLSTRDADITACDHHPSVASFLRANAELNGLAPIAFVRTGWADANLELGRFDLIIGSDLLYEPSSPELLSGFVARHSKPACRMVLVDPGRGLQSKFTARMVEHGYVHESTKRVDSTAPNAYKGQVLSYVKSLS
ncbi:MAG: methyltransferase domain-containing protein [Chromatiales bacterium]|jgi:ETFB lysine methyltransferase|nr:methyltransferase domain-containing protein [Chromatiales bacterium]